MSHKVTCKFDNQAHGLLKHMAKEAGVSTSDMVEIAVFNLISLYVKDNRPELVVLPDAETLIHRPPSLVAPGE